MNHAMYVALDRIVCQMHDFIIDYDHVDILSLYAFILAQTVF